MTKSMPNHAVITAQAMIFCYVSPDLVNRYMLIPKGITACEIRYIGGGTISINDHDRISDVASMIYKFTTNSQIGEH